MLTLCWSRSPSRPPTSLTERCGWSPCGWPSARLRGLRRTTARGSTCSHARCRRGSSRTSCRRRASRSRSCRTSRPRRGTMRRSSFWPRRASSPMGHFSRTPPRRARRPPHGWPFSGRWTGEGSADTGQVSSTAESLGGGDAPATRAELARWLVEVKGWASVKTGRALLGRAAGSSGRGGHRDARGPSDRFPPVARSTDLQ